MKQLLCLMGLLGTMAQSIAMDLRGTVFDEAGKKYNIDPELLYSIALVESAVVDEGDVRKITPSPWTLRTSRPFYARSRDEAERLLRRLFKSNKSVDVGLCQINTLWHGHRVSKITDLLDPELNVEIAARILSEHIEKNPKNAVAAIGAYHSSNPELALRYAKRVLGVYTNIKAEKK